MFNRNMAMKAAENLRSIRERKPLVHNITNYVVMNYTANALLACGASPVMAHAAEEVEEMVSLAGALVLNIGTLSPPWVHAMLRAGKKANALHVPVILDPVGAGATSLRTDSAKRLIEELSIQVIRGNASEILSLGREKSKARTKGVDSIHSVDQAAETAIALAVELRTTLAITGTVDLITDGNRICRVMNGHEMMSHVTGTGCTATAIIGAFLAVEPDSMEAAATGLSYFGLAGEKAAERSFGPGTFQISLLDALYEMKEDDLMAEAKIQI
ncbi:MAG: hydroxyethylthiazole kinase [Deltaproteobacteria bacterium CG_4_9_14_3_um_filter_44_9]|nr:MAG: hydroxyethylthiazole kinase [Deltaproteobacteria bacterium CG06_land_8_20_14_3_00_44_19]PIX24926.1 MAG: hydroxyethylthiazole kinase [Deltaproteobacteria bacterium CG_4_8_14_3_um_filter_43_13]PIZ19838.1 MAG: hydroxyethylthiazole kinase [Deltaproteobacteria bacterium CG_4_10_14_0_8_um_filter_43_12]PJB43292.1 MAG: hydroxyethylthiazole kinase [Deltaproteobacteria bacterium CG_4_9_14_3_um_filter_44_9]